jgi:hypothetical protein
VQVNDQLHAPAALPTGKEPSGYTLQSLSVSMNLVVQSAGTLLSFRERRDISDVQYFDPTCIFPGKGNISQQFTFLIPASSKRKNFWSPDLKRDQAFLTCNVFNMSIEYSSAFSVFMHTPMCTNARCWQGSGGQNPHLVPHARKVSGSLLLYFQYDYSW